MADENVLFQPVKDYCQHAVVTCSPDDQVVAVAGKMREHGISSVVVCAGGMPVGVVTDRDLRNKVVASGLDPAPLEVRAIMSAPLITLEEDDFLFEALHKMSEHNIHRLGVVNAAGRLAGIITYSDILQLQTRSPQQMLREIEDAPSIAHLAEVHKKVEGLVVHLSGTGVRAPDLIRMIAHLNDRILLRLIALLRRDRYPDLPQRFAFIVLGSEGRQEQTLITDQDNAIVHADDLTAGEVERLEAFAQELIDNLIAIGVPPCPGGIMAKNAAWRRSLRDWVRVLDEWLSVPSPDNILNCSMFCDLRFIYGDPTLERELGTIIVERLQGHTGYLAHMGANILNFPPPLDLFGKIKVERSGSQRGQLDLKKGGIFAVTEGVKILALEAGCRQGGTQQRLQALVEAEVLTQREAQDLEASFNFLVLLRLRGQVEALRQGERPGNFFPLARLNGQEQGQLRLALQEVRNFQEMLKRRFRLNLYC